MPKWSPNNDYELRVPADWKHVGGHATVAVGLEMLSDEHSTAETNFDLTENVPNAAFAALLHVQTLIQESPAEALGHLKVLKRSIPGNLNFGNDLKQLQLQASRAATIQLTRLQRQVAFQKQRIALLRRNRRRANFADRQSIDLQIDIAQSQLNSANDLIHDLRRLR